MTLSVEMITFDCADPDTLAGWWAQAVDGSLNAFAPGEFVLVQRPDGPNLGFQRVPAAIRRCRVGVHEGQEGRDPEAGQVSPSLTRPGGP